MISIVIASINKSALAALSKNIADTIGVPYEIIAFDNAGGPKGLCEIYNEGAKKARYDTLCYMHEDIELKTADWGKIVLQLFKDNPEYKLLGVAGSDYKSLAPSGWHNPGVESRYMNIMQTFKFHKKEPEHIYKNPSDSKKIASVVCIDGVWFCVPKHIALEIGFDEQTFKKFHVYDLDFSLAVALKYRVGVTFDILINHFSEGNYDHTWIEEILKFQQKWVNHLPVNLRPLSDQDALHTEKITFRYFTKELVKFKFPVNTAIGVLNLNNRFRKLDLKLYFKLYFYTLRKHLLR